MPNLQQQLKLLLDPQRTSDPAKLKKIIKNSYTFKTEVIRHKSLEEAAQAGLNSGQLQASYPPLRQIERYSGLLALLRWAVTAERNGLIDVDFGDLAFVSSYNEAFPTPDVEIVVPN